MTGMEITVAAGLILFAVALWWGMESRRRDSKSVAHGQRLSEEEISRLQISNEELKQMLQQSREQVARLEERDNLHKEWMEKDSERMREWSDKVLVSQREELTRQGGQTFRDTLGPFEKQMKEMREKMENLNTEATKERTSLHTLVRELSDQAQQVSAGAGELTQALKGDSKMRGDWGEISLARVLEASGLEKGREYETQSTFTPSDDEDNRRLRPDVIIRLPDNRNIVIDAKLTLNSWLEWSAATNEEEAARAAKAFLSGVERQIKELADKRYDDLDGVRQLDFTLLYMPIEPAYIFVIQQRPQLSHEIFKKRVALVSPTTLLPVLRVVENIWRLERQNLNATEIVSTAEKMHRKLNTFLESMEKLDKGLGTARSAYDAAHKQLTSGKGNLIGQAQKMTRMGVPKRTELPDSFRLSAEDEENHESEEPARLPKETAQQDGKSRSLK